MDTNIVCARCGGPGANCYSDGEWTHYFMLDCLDHLRTRVATAEAEAADLKALAQRWANKHAALVVSVTTQVAKACELEDKLARQAFVTDRRPPDRTEVEVLLIAQWEPKIVPQAAGHWRDRRYETVNGVLGWRARETE